MIITLILKLIINSKINIQSKGITTRRDEMLNSRILLINKITDTLTDE